MAMNSDSAKPTENQAIVATGLTKRFGEGEAMVTAVNGVGLVAHFTAQTTLLTNQRTALNLRMEQLTASVQLIKALGGGWDISHGTTAAIP